MTRRTPNNPTPRLRSERWHPPKARGLALLVGLLVLTLIGCSSPPPKPKPVEDIPLPSLGQDAVQLQQGTYAVIRRVDVPLSESTDDAWAIINEQLVPPVTRGIWRGNGLRIGLLPRDQLEAYTEAMPQPVSLGRSFMNKSDYPVPILETPRLRGSLRFEIDLTRPPRPRVVETIQGGEKSRLRLLAQIEEEPDGRHTLVLTPHHHIPSPLDLIPRSPLEKELDGRVYDELALRITPGQDQVAVVGLHWPWPIGEVLEEDEPARSAAASRTTTREAPRTTETFDRNDPAAPPAHLQPVEGNEGEEEEEAQDAGDGTTPSEPQPREPRYARIAPPLTTTFGSTLLTGTRIRQPVRTVLLITIEEAKETQPE